MDRLGPIKWLQDLASACLTDKLCGHKCMSLLRSRHSLWHLPVSSRRIPLFRCWWRFAFCPFLLHSHWQRRACELRTWVAFFYGRGASAKHGEKKCQGCRKQHVNSILVQESKISKEELSNQSFHSLSQKVCTSSDVACHICQEWNSMTLYWPVLHTHAYYVTLLKTLAVQRHFSKKSAVAKPPTWVMTLDLLSSAPSSGAGGGFSFRHLLLHRTSHRHGGPRCTRTGKRPEQWALH